MTEASGARRMVAAADVQRMRAALRAAEDGDPEPVTQLFRVLLRETGDPQRVADIIRRAQTNPAD